MRTSWSAVSPVVSLAAHLDLAAGGPDHPAMAFIRVDFPAPFGPTMAVIAPGLASREMSSMMGGPPYPR